MDDVQVYICSTDLSSKCQPLFSATCPWAILLSLASLGSRIWGGDLHIVVYWGCSLEHHLGSSDVYRVAQGVAELCCSPKRLSQSHRNLMILQICSKLGQGGSDFICQDYPPLVVGHPQGRGIILSESTSLYGNSHIGIQPWTMAANFSVCWENAYPAGLPPPDD